MTGSSSRKPLTSSGFFRYRSPWRKWSQNSFRAPPPFHGQGNNRACRGIFVSVGKEAAEAVHPSGKAPVQVSEAQPYSSAGTAVGLAVEGHGLPLGGCGHKGHDAAPAALLEHCGIVGESVAPE